MLLHPPLAPSPARGAPRTECTAPSRAIWRAWQGWWITPRTPHAPVEPGCVIDGGALAAAQPPREPLASLDDTTRPYAAGLVLLLDHRHAGALDLLRAIQSAQPRRFADGVVVGVEHLPADDAPALAAYRAAATGVPVFAVDLRRTGDRTLLVEALVSTRVLAGLRRRWSAQP